MSYNWPKVGEKGTAEVLQRVLREHIEDPNAHESFYEFLQEHNEDRSAHDIDDRILEALRRHTEDPQAHQTALEHLFSSWLEEHESKADPHPNITGTVRRIIYEVIQRHVNSIEHPPYATYRLKTSPEEAKPWEVFYLPELNTLALKLPSGKYLIADYIAPGTREAGLYLCFRFYELP